MKNHNTPFIICIMGPTASGKSDLAMKICDVMPCEIISVDSVQVYRGLNIGTAKPTCLQRKSYPHHLIDIREPDNPYSVADFRNNTLKLLPKIIAKGKIPLLVGGTMLYFKTLMYGLTDLPKANINLRNKIVALADSKGWKIVHKMLEEMDYDTAKRINYNDSQRLQRAIEICILSGKTLKELQSMDDLQPKFPYSFINLTIAPEERSILHEKIAKRCQQMFKQGFIEEVQFLYTKNELNSNLPAMRSVGYRQIWQFLDGKLDKNILIEKCIIASRQLAKKQLTWLKNWPEKLNWLNSFSSNLLTHALNIIHQEMHKCK